MLHIPVNIAAQAAAMGDPNWTLIGIMAGIFLILAIAFAIPLKEPKALVDEDRSRKALDDEKKNIKAIEDKSDVDKDSLSLAEIKESKRASVAEGKSKEELRRLREERRAATQTEKAIQERSEMDGRGDEAKKSEAVKADEEKTENVETVDAAQEEPVSANEKAAAVSVDDEMRLADSADVSASEDDIFSKLFGGTAELISLDDVTESLKSDDDVVFPSLGSKLIPLNQQTKSVENSEELDTLSELTKRFADKAEKKTLS